MKLTIITTPIHDALGIAAEVSASIEAKVQAVAAIDFASFISDVDALAVALYASHPSVRTQYLHLPTGDVRRLATEKALGWYDTPESILPLVSQGYFNDQLSKLLAMAKANTLHGMKLAPIFSTFLDNVSQYRLDSSLVSDVRLLLILMDHSDGFLLINQAEDECIIILSCWAR